MKKTAAAIIFAFIMLFAMSASADSVSVNGREPEFTPETGIPFVNSDNRTMVPVRLISENLGADVAWSDAEQKVTVTTEKHTVELFIGSRDMIVDGEKKQMDTAAVEKGGRTYLPVRYIAEAIGCHVMWFDRKETAVVMDSDYYGRYVTFRDMFTYEGILSDYTEVIIVTAISQGRMTLDEIKDLWAGLSGDDKELFVALATMEKHQKNPQYPISAAYIFKDTDGKQYYLATASTFSYDVQIFNPFEN